VGADLAGYGQQTALFAPRVAEHYDLQVSSFYGLDGSPLNWNGIKILPGLGGTYGNEALPMHARRHFGSNRGGLVVTLMDVWVLNAQMAAQFDMACWCPVDHDPAPPNVRKFFRESGAIPVAMSRFGQEQLAEFDALYVPHGVDTKVFRPMDKAEARAKLGVPPDEFAIGAVAANKGNPSRKSLVASLEAFAEFRRGHENAKLYLHTDLEGSWSAGVPLLPVIEALGIPDEAIGRSDPYAIYFHPSAPEVMALFYSSMDVLLSPSTGEGFGIPILEAQSCGTPAIVTDFSAMPEVCGAGWHVKGHRWWTPQESWQCQPEVAGIVVALEKCYAMPKDARQKLSHAARSHALKYDVDVVMEKHMLPALEAVRERLAARTASVELKLRDAA
jgi:glycosyltransferase involved in cell wall biosynthesis